MNVYVPLTIIVVVLCLMVRNNSNLSSKFFAFSFIVLFLFSALRYEFGPDYESYRIIYNDIKPGLTEERQSEFVFYYWLRLFPSYTLFIVVSSLLWLVTYYYFFRRNVNYHYYWMLLLFLLCNEGCFIDSLVAMRSATFAFMFIVAVNCLEKGGFKGKCQYLLIVLLGCFVHSSSVIFAPLVFLNTKAPRMLTSKLFLVIVCAITILSLFLGHNSLLIMASTLFIDKVDALSDYSGYIDFMSDGGGGSLFRHALLKSMVFIPLLSICFSAKDEKESRYNLYNKLAILLSVFALIFGQGMMSRFYMILNPFYIVSLIRSFNYRFKVLSVVALLCVILADSYMLFSSMQADYNMSFLTYKSLFSAPSIP